MTFRPVDELFSFPTSSKKSKCVDVLHTPIIGIKRRKQVTFWVTSKDLDRFIFKYCQDAERWRRCKDISCDEGCSAKLLWYRRMLEQGWRYDTLDVPLLVRALPSL